MKTLLLLRHAKAEWGSFNQPDAERALSERGERQAHDIASKMKSEGLTPDFILSSRAKRTEMTTQILIAGMDCDMQQVQWCDDLYLAEAGALLNAVRQANDTVQILALVVHNPGVSELAQYLLNEAVHEMSTATVVAITWDIEHWSDISEGTGALRAYLRP
ncbi:MAG: hypothetical protein COB41_09845 [Proteobacteria bacterium]|nr:MAG: hypothetical protein COB41_09845 [Pseudomonadota bacterium]